jgi:hypothetical protein
MNRMKKPPIAKHRIVVSRALAIDVDISRLINQYELWIRIETDAQPEGDRRRYRARSLDELLRIALSQEEAALCFSPAARGPVLTAIREVIYKAQDLITSSTSEDSVRLSGGENDPRGFWSPVGPFQVLLVDPKTVALAYSLIVPTPEDRSLDVISLAAAAMIVARRASTSATFGREAILHAIDRTRELVAAIPG